MTFQEAVQRFYRRCASMGLSDLTIQNYRYQFLSVTRFFYAKEKNSVENITPDDIRAYLVYMREYGYAPDTIRDRYNGLSTFFRFLCEEGILVQNPMKPVKKPKLPKIPARTFTTTELQKILSYYDEKTFTSLRNKCILYILYGTGLRRAELLGLSVTSIHADEAIISVIGKGQKYRAIPITPVLDKILRKYMKARKERLLDLQVETNALIIGKWGKPLTTGGLREVFRELKAGTGITGNRVSSHTMRHSFARNWVRNNGSIFGLQKVLSHGLANAIRRFRMKKLLKKLV